MNRAQRRLALLLAAGFLLVLALVTIAEAESQLSDFAADGVTADPRHVWCWQVTSVLAWLSVTPVIWWVVARGRPPRRSWPVAAVLFLLGLPIASAWHVGLMIALRTLTYASWGEHYRFEGAVRRPYLYEFRKDVVTYV